MNPSETDASRTMVHDTSFEGRPLFARLETAETLVAIRKALENSSTWGDFRRLMPAAQLAQIERAMREDAEQNDDALESPQDSDPFEGESVPGYSDGDWPTWIAASMLQELPEAVISAFGTVQTSVLNGEFVEFEARDVPAIKAMLAELGWTTIERPDLRLDPILAD